MSLSLALVTQFRVEEVFACSYQPGWKQDPIESYLQWVTHQHTTVVLPVLLKCVRDIGVKISQIFDSLLQCAQ